MFSKKEKQIDMELFTIYDSKTESYGVPTTAINAPDLIRQVINMFQNPQQQENQYLKNAEDFSIFKIGSYDKKTGLIESCNLTHVANMHDLRAAAQQAQGQGALAST